MELNRLEKISLNNNPTKWEQNINSCLKISSLNCQSLKPKIKHLKDDPIVNKSDVICLSETWLCSDTTDISLEIEGFEIQLNSNGHGKGVATYYRKDKFHHCLDIKEADMQITKLSSDMVELLSVYRSSNGDPRKLSDLIIKNITPEKTTVVCGDVNICFKSDRNNNLIKTLEGNGFDQYVKEATHIKGGLIDHVYVKQGSNGVGVDVCLYSPYYCAKDHDALLLTLDLNSQETR